MNNLTNILSAFADEIEAMVDQRVEQKLAELADKKLEKKFIDVYAAAEYLSISHKTLYNYCQQGLISFYKPNGKIYFTIKDLDEYISNKENYYLSNDALDKIAESKVLMRNFRR